MAVSHSARKYNESKRLAERHHCFNVHELCNVIANAVGRTHSDIRHFSKIAEGGSYRVFEATLANNTKVIARLPYPCSLPRRYGVASEVATMEYLRMHGIPIPKVLAWSSSTDNAVGSEYMVMERVAGQELGRTWYSMSRDERSVVIKNIVEVEKRLFEIPFPACGSIFFNNDLDANHSTVPIDTEPELAKFCLGPSTDYLWWYHGRDAVEVDRGPWRTTEAVMKAPAERELAWLHKYGKPRFPIDYLHRDLYDNKLVDPAERARQLSDYLEIVPHILPSKISLHKPTIRHPDLSPSNIFVSSTGEVTGIIDWQHATVLPIILQAIIPKHFQNYGDTVSDNLGKPELPDGYDDLSEDEKAAEQELYRRRQVHYYYLGYTGQFNPLHLQAMGNGALVLKHELFDVAGRPWEGDNLSLQAKLIDVMRYWEPLATSTVNGSNDCPLQMDESAIQDYLVRFSEKSLDEKSLQIRNHIGIDGQGWVANDMFEAAKQRSAQLFAEMSEAAETVEGKVELEEHWPFQDHEELD